MGDTHQRKRMILEGMILKGIETNVISRQKLKPDCLS